MAMSYFEFEFGLGDMREHCCVGCYVLSSSDKRVFSGQRWVFMLGNHRPWNLHHYESHPSCLISCLNLTGLRPT